MSFNEFLGRVSIYTGINYIRDEKLDIDEEISFIIGALMVYYTDSRETIFRGRGETQEEIQKSENLIRILQNLSVLSLNQIFLLVSIGTPTKKIIDSLTNIILTTVGMTPFTYFQNQVE